MKSPACFKKLLFAVTVATAASTAIAVVNPSVATPGVSQGEFDITLNVGDDIIINNLADLVLPEFDSGTDLVAAQNLCVGRKGASSGSPLGYVITATNSSTAFALTNGSDQIPYKVFFDDEVASVQSATGLELVNGTTNLNDFATPTDSTACTDGVSNATVWVKANKADLTGKSAGEYTDTVTLTVAVK